MARLAIVVEVDEDPRLIDPEEVAEDILDLPWRLVSAEWVIGGYQP